ncbi:MAG: hypothetical protein JXA87_07945 [Thermoleophilia bacterium]|nr:hypothetical protein [Thermoleophilia bacterium]
MPTRQDLMSNRKYRKLLEPGYIGPVKTKSRLILTRSERSAREVYALGDSREPAYIVDAVEDGARIGGAI